ncbi:MADS-box protein SOC1 isoform X1 [Senna tora]|uniref:MADS-box protein SOC1 isoform X1 n=1 Tax=Senna tora TaxID=362788 RepID=A0A834TQP9_9FABA|nr:MADS-box protein SOC1 isoform X1 [Senna tora]
MYSKVLFETLKKYLNPPSSSLGTKYPAACQRQLNATASIPGILNYPIDQLNKICRKLLGEGLGSCTLEELQEIEQQLEKSVNSVRAKKVYREHIEQLKAKCGMQAQKATNVEHRESQGYAESSSPSSDVETELFIGLPETRSTRRILPPPPLPPLPQ